MSKLRRQMSANTASVIETKSLIDIKDKTNLRMMEKLLGIGDKFSNKLKTSMENIQKYQLTYPKQLRMILVAI